jgi:spore coat protein JC
LYASTPLLGVRERIAAASRFFCASDDQPKICTAEKLAFLNPENACPARFSRTAAQETSSAGTEELGHLEMVGTIVHQLTRNLTEQQIKEAGYDAYFVDHTAGVYPTAASGTPWSADGIAVTGDTIADLTEDLAAEQKARVTYDNILRFSDDPDVTDAIRFLRAREIVHFQRFGEGLRLAKDRLDSKNVYFINPSFDTK